MPFTTFLQGVKSHKRRHEFKETVDHSYRRPLARSQKVGLDRAREVVDKGHVWCFLRQGLEGQGDERAAVAASGKRRDLPALEIVDFNRAFFASGTC